jgi:hypothetical protein
MKASDEGNPKEEGKGKETKVTRKTRKPARKEEERYFFSRVGGAASITHGYSSRYGELGRDRRKEEIPKEGPEDN